MRMLFIVSLLIYFTLSSGQQWSPAIEDDIIGFITNVMDCRRVPGMSVAVVQKGSVLMQRGFGLADIDEGVPVTENTRFCIGSCTKAVMATLMGSILDEYNGTYPNGWDTKLIDVFGPEFQLGDSHVTELVTIKDTLTHRIGLGQYIGGVIAMVDPTKSRHEYCERLKYFEAVAEFRNEFIYNNWMFMLTSCVAEEISGQTFEQLVQERIFDQLGMTETILSEQGLVPGEVATSYFINETSDQIGAHDPELIGIYPADASGAVCGPITDLAKWAQFNLDDLTLPVLSTDTWKDIMTAQFIQGQSDVSIPSFPVTNDMPNYGLGWGIGTYRGYRKASHSGSIAGFECLTTVFHDVDLAIITSANGPMHSSDTASVLHFYISDLVLGLEPWLDNTTACSYPAPWASTQTEAQSCTSDLYVDDSILDLEQLSTADANDPTIGQYGHPFFGNLTVSFDEDTQELRFDTGRYGTGFLVRRPVVEAMYEVHFEGPLAYFAHVSPNYELYPPILFRELVGNSTHGEYQEIYAIGIEPRAPPTYYRGFQWDDAYPPPNTNRL